MSDRPPSDVLSPRPGERMFVFKEAENPTGGNPRIIAFTNVDIKPLSYEELEAARPHQGITIPLDMYNGQIIETDVEGIDASAYVHFKSTLVSPFTAKALGLVRGGWLPSGLAASKGNAVVLPDRNIVSEIAGRFEEGKRQGREPDFLDLFENAPIKINPMLYPMEGNGRALPDAARATAQLAEVVAKLRKALPSATLMVGPESLRGLLGLNEEARPQLARKQAFLKHIAPMLGAPVARRHVDVRWREILAAADEFAIGRASLIVLAALSTLVNPRGQCAARRLLKLHARYSDEDAYNALCDLRSLELLLYCLAFFPEYEVQLCTADRSLALFWAGSGASGVERNGSGVRYDMTPHDALLPGDYSARWADDVREAPESCLGT